MPSPKAAGPLLQDVLRELGPRVQRGAPPRCTLPPAPTGIPTFDRLLGGGFPRGGLSEIAGPTSSGRTSLALALLARATGDGELTAVIDVADAFDPPSAETAGVDLERLLWIRAPGLREALRSVHHLLGAGGFGVVLLDIAGRVGRGEEPGARTWPRLRRALHATDTALVMLGDARVALTFADLALEMQPASARFSEQAIPRTDLAGDFFHGLQGTALLVRSRRGAHDRSVSAHWPRASDAA